MALHSETSNEKKTSFGLYVHWPFCQAKCPYCDFNSHVRQSPINQKDYVEAFKSELRHVHQQTSFLKVRSIFFGGGTPSLMFPETVARLLDFIHTLWDVDREAEISLEANPTSVEAKRFKGFHAAGVNRVSLGVQALNDTDLKRLGRMHSVEQAIQAIDIARSTFKRLSFDLIYARPHQSLLEWEHELKRAIDMAADHFSLYQLTIEPDTMFEKMYQAGMLEMPAPELSADLYALTQMLTKAHGLPCYEISNHAHQGAECQHNLTYWRYGYYGGVGPGAHGRLPAFDAKGCLDTSLRVATSTLLHPETWLKRVQNKGHGFDDYAPLSRDEASDEFLLMGLRLMEGIHPDHYTKIAGKTLNAQALKMHLEQGFLDKMGDHRLRLTSKGMMLTNRIIADLAA